jgi:UDP-2-acetamido-3-amino-2,3-dideoxy-glucuronate N-acetyltransferase
MAASLCARGLFEVSEMREDPRFPGSLIHMSSFVDDGAIIGRGTKIWHFCHVLPSTVIGENCSIGQNVVIGPRVKIGNGCKVQNNVSIYDGVELADDVFCGPSCVFTNVNNPRANVSRKDEFRTTPVGRGNPARRAGWMSRAGERLGKDLVCPRTGERYRELSSMQLALAG